MVSRKKSAPAKATKSARAKVSAVKKATPKKAGAKKAVPKKEIAKKSAAKKSAAKKAVKATPKTTKKVAPKKAATKKVASKKAASAKTVRTATKPRRSKTALSMLRFPRPSMTSQLGGRSDRLPPRLQATIDKVEIADVLTTFARALDRMDENLLRSILHHDATLDMGPGVFQGGSGDYVHWVLSVLRGVRSSHHLVTNVRIELDGDTALVESYFHIHVRVEKPTGREDVFLGGRYMDRFERRPAGAAGMWKIMHRKQVLDWARTEAASDIFYHQNPDALWSSRTKTDPSYAMAQLPGSTSEGRQPSFLGRHYEVKSVKF